MVSKSKSPIAIFFTATLIALLIRLFIIEDFRISSDSMKPNLLQGDLVFNFKMAYGIRLPFSSYEFVRYIEPKRGDVIAFTLPDDSQGTFIKRIVAIEGDSVELRAGTLYIDGRPADHQGQNDKNDIVLESVQGSQYYEILYEPDKLQDYGPVQVPEDHFFVMGDNRSPSTDSRTWGPLPVNCILGKVALVWLSVGEQGIRKERIGRWVN